MNGTRTDGHDQLQPSRALAVDERHNVIYRVCGRRAQADREPFAAGHPVTWGMLTDGTELDGSVYPFPVFQR